jgi:hypothetical protein
MLAGWPNKWTGRIATVFLVMAEVILWRVYVGGIELVHPPTQALRLFIKTAFIVATKVTEGMITSDPSFQPCLSFRAWREILSPAVPELVNIACFAPWISANLFLTPGSCRRKLNAQT